MKLNKRVDETGNKTIINPEPKWMAMVGIFPNPSSQVKQNLDLKIKMHYNTLGNYR